MKSESPEGKLLRQRIKQLAWPMLREHGFAKFSDSAAWRTSERWIDCVQFQTMPPRFGSPHYLGRREGEDIYATPATFQLHVGTYYLDVHRLPWSGPAPERPTFPRGERSRKPACHRWITLARSQSLGNLQGTIFWVRPDGSNIDQMLEDSVNALRQRGLPWLKKTHDIQEYISVSMSEGSRSQSGPESIPNSFLSPQEWVSCEAWNGDDDLIDHHGADQVAAYGDLLVGLLIGSGRWDEALRLQRQSADRSWVDKKHSQELEVWGNDPSMRRTIASLHRFALKVVEREAEHLRMLEDLYRRETE